MKAFLVYEETDRWWRVLLKAQFHHVSIVLMTEHNYIVLNSRGAGVDVFIQGCESTDDVEKRLYGLYTGIQEVSIPTFKTNEDVPMGLFTCVEFVKRVVGIRNRWIQTPSQLYNYIQKRRIT